MRLFKYFHPDRTDVLLNGMIRFSSPKILNDPFELKPYISGIADNDYLGAQFEKNFTALIEEEYAQSPEQLRLAVSFEKFQQFAEERKSSVLHGVREHTKKLTPKINSIINNKFEEIIGILCFTESAENILMWAHYADSHQGFVVEFDENSPFFNQRKSDEDEMRHLRKIVYRNERPAINLTDIDDLSSFLTKGIDWSYEQEWRMMLPLVDANKVIDDGSNRIHLFHYPKEAIRSIIFGCRSKVETKNAVFDAIGNLNIPCYQAKINDMHYKLDFHPISNRELDS
ncbi:DUF2971 domain-containing protein [Chitinibacter sp. S2-10]|uniref:DUF2971 domain-containing protein n=1 Tax=Chitinibacter sp. S2-10 TaxID=3373597 RepID=UPI0039777179